MFEPVQDIRQPAYITLYTRVVRFSAGAVKELNGARFLRVEVDRTTGTIKLTPTQEDTSNTAEIKQYKSEHVVTSVAVIRLFHQNDYQLQTRYRLTPHEDGSYTVSNDDIFDNKQESIRFLLGSKFGRRR